MVEPDRPLKPLRERLLASRKPKFATHPDFAAVRRALADEALSIPSEVLDTVAVWRLFHLHELVFRLDIEKEVGQFTRAAARSRQKLWRAEFRDGRLTRIAQSLASEITRHIALANGLIDHVRKPRRKARGKPPFRRIPPVSASSVGVLPDGVTEEDFVRQPLPVGWPAPTINFVPSRKAADGLLIALTYETLFEAFTGLGRKGPSRIAATTILKWLRSWDMSFTTRDTVSVHVRVHQFFTSDGGCRLLAFLAAKEFPLPAADAERVAALLNKSRPLSATERQWLAVIWQQRPNPAG